MVAHHLNGDRDNMYDLVSELLNEHLDDDTTPDDDDSDFDAAVMRGDAEFRYRAVTRGSCSAICWYCRHQLSAAPRNTSSPPARKGVRHDRQRIGNRENA